MVASKKLKGALSKLHAEEGRMNFGRKQDQNFYDYMDELVKWLSLPGNESGGFAFGGFYSMRNLWGGVIRTALASKKPVCQESIRR